MALVTLPSPLRELAGGRTKVHVDGTTVGDVVLKLERSYPRLSGWLMDERAEVRRHVNLFLNGERASLETTVSAGDVIHVLPAISGGQVDLEGGRRSVRCSPI